MAPITFDELSESSRAAMLTTARVGDPAEDPTMKVMRPKLSQINALGFITTDSQMGKAFPEEECQRAYISGFVSKKYAERIEDLLLKEGLYVDMQPPRPDDQPFFYGERYPLTMDYGDVHTGHPMECAPTFEEEWINTLPELGLADDVESMNAMEPQIVTLFVADKQWGRETWLFDVVIAALKRANAN